VITPVHVTVCVCNSFILQVNPNIMATKKRKICDEHRFFNNSWVDLYFFVENKGKPLCLICQKIKFFTLIFLCKIIKYNSNTIISIYHM
jgi:hypothetical protein